MIEDGHARNLEGVPAPPHQGNTRGEGHAMISRIVETSRIGARLGHAMEQKSSKWVPIALLLVAIIAMFVIVLVLT
jgi:hypothetical protein